MTLTISPALHSLIPPLSPEELHQLEANILADGCRDPLIVWHEEQILLDGHHRLQICEQHGLSYRVHELNLPDMDAAKAWMIAHQLGRRNLSPNQMAYYRGEQYNLQKQRHGGDRKSEESSSQNEYLKTGDRLAAEHGVSRATITRDGAYAAAVETLAEVLGPDARQAILAGDLALTKQDVPVLAAMVEASPEVATQVKAALQGEAPADGLHAIVAGSRSSGLLGGAPALVLEPEDPERETPASTLTERDRACAGPRDEKPAGSIAWCWQTLDLFKIRWQRKDFTDQQFEEILEELRVHEVWKVIPPEAPYGSLEALLCAELGLDHPRLHAEALLPSRVGDTLHEALGHLEMLAAFYRDTPPLFELHQKGYLALKEACLRFAALFGPAPLAPPDASAPAPTPPRLRDQVGLQHAVFQTVQQLQPCTNAAVKDALGERRAVTHQALLALVGKGKLVKEGQTYRVA